MIPAPEFAPPRFSNSPRRSRATGNQLRMIARLIAGAVEDNAGPVNCPDRRRYRRVPYSRILSVTPATPEGRPLKGESLVAFGKEISLRGIDFYHREPLTHRHVIVSAIGPDEAATTMLLELTRCQFLAAGRYTSGGRFVSFVEHPEA